jgi:hypothetical protein
LDSSAEFAVDEPRWVSLNPRASLSNQLAVLFSNSASSLHFEPDSIEGRLQEMDGAVVGGDDEVAVGPLGVFVSADEKLQGELFEHGILGGLKFIIG